MARRRRSFTLDLNAQGTVVLRSRLDTERGNVVGFAIQIELADSEQREIIVRFDTSHGYVHQHSFARGSAQVRTRLDFRDWREAYTYCYRYARANWETERERYLRGN